MTEQEEQIQILSDYQSIQSDVQYDAETVVEDLRERFGMKNNDRSLISTYQTSNSK